MMMPTIVLQPRLPSNTLSPTRGIKLSPNTSSRQKILRMRARLAREKKSISPQAPSLEAILALILDPGTARSRVDAPTERIHKPAMGRNRVAVQQLTLDIGSRAGREEEKVAVSFRTRNASNENGGKQRLLPPIRPTQAVKTKKRGEEARTKARQQIVILLDKLTTIKAVMPIPVMRVTVKNSRTNPAIAETMTVRHVPAERRSFLGQKRMQGYRSRADRAISPPKTETKSIDPAEGEWRPSPWCNKKYEWDSQSGSEDAK